MSDEDESTPPGMIVAAERAILKFLRGREANEAIASHEGTREDRGTSNVNQLAQHHLAPASPVKQTKTIEELAAMIHQDLSQLEDCPERGVKVTVYGLNPWNSMLTFGVDAGSVPNKTDLQSFCDTITERSGPKGCPRRARPPLQASVHAHQRVRKSQPLLGITKISPRSF